MLSEEGKEAIERLNEILKEYEEIVNIEDKTEREIEMSLYMEDMPFAEIKTVLNLITNLQKENEDLQREKEENKLIIAMANNEMLGYNQGYSDGKNQNSNATEIIIKNRQAYMHKEEVEFYKRKIEFLKKENEEKDKQIDLMSKQLAGLTIFDIEKDEPLILTDKEEVISYFANKVNSKIQ